MIWQNINLMISWIPLTLRPFIIGLIASAIIIGIFKFVKWIKELILF